jgi:hypothetical protein
MFVLPCPEPMSAEQIAQEAHKFWLDIVNVLGKEHILQKGIIFDEVYDNVIYPRYEIYLDKETDLGVDYEGNEILGEFLPADNTALVSKRLYSLNDKRTVFTQWHEVCGHGILQGKFIRKNKIKYPKLYTTQKTINLISNTFEFQANCFGAHLAAPISLIRCICIMFFGTDRFNYIGPGSYNLYVNGRDFKFFIESPQELAKRIAMFIQKYFGGLSIESLSYQILKAVVDCRAYNQDKVHYQSHFYKPIGQILKRTMHI